MAVNAAAAIASTAAGDEDEGLLLTLLIGPLLTAALTGTTQLNSTLGDRLVGQFLAALDPVTRAPVATI
ncbi:MAG: hypothetical protein ABI862_13870 [Ilumatobacteraceae bacterium]